MDIVLLGERMKHNFLFHISWFIVTCCSLLLSTSAKAQLLGERVQINSSILQQTRDIQVVLPENYSADKQTNYPVLYILDGDYNINSVAAMLDFMGNRAQLIPDIIVVGIADKGTGAYRQNMTPARLTSPFKEKPQGQAEQFLSFIKQELKPYMQQHYRIANNDILFGQSIGGLFVLNTLVNDPQSFTTFLAVSPALWLNQHAFSQHTRQLLSQSSNLNANLYLSLGDETRMGVYGFVEVLDDLQPKQLTWFFKRYPNENHNSVGMVALRDNLSQLFAPWSIAEAELNQLQDPHKLVNHYVKLMQQWQINQAIPTPVIKALIRYFYRQQRVDEVNEFVDKAVQQLPASAAALIMMQASYLGYSQSAEAELALLLIHQQQFKTVISYLQAIASAYEKTDNLTLAHDYYQQSQQQAIKQNSPQWLLNILDVKIATTQTQ